MKINILGVDMNVSDKVIYATEESSREYINAIKRTRCKDNEHCECDGEVCRNKWVEEFDKKFRCDCENPNKECYQDEECTVRELRGELKEFISNILAEQRTYHEDLLINQAIMLRTEVLDEVKNSLEKELEKWDESAAELEDGWGNYTVCLPWELKEKKVEISNIIDQLKLK